MTQPWYDAITEADEVGWPMHALNGRELDHYAGGKPDECPRCRHNHFDDRDARDDCPACRDLIRQAGG